MSGERLSAETDTTTTRVEQHVETQFLRDGEWTDHVLIRRDEIGRVKFRHRTVVVTTTRHNGEWQQGRRPVPGSTAFPVHLGRKGDPIFTECDIDRANARRWTWERDDVTCEKCLAVVFPPGQADPS